MRPYLPKPRVLGDYSPLRTPLKTLTYTVLVPKLGTSPAHMILPGSGIVAETTTDDRVLVYFEGNRYGSAGLDDFSARCLTAAGRLHERYPTVAFGLYPTADFDVVGTFTVDAQWRSHRLAITDQATLDRWTGAGQ